MWFKLALGGILLFQASQERLTQVTLDYESRILEKGKYVTVSGTVSFNKKAGELITHLVKPFETVTIVNSEGDLRVHDPSANTVVRSRSAFNTSEASYLTHFLSGTYSDLGLAKAGYIINGTRIDKGMMITTWIPKPGSQTPIGRIELVKEKELPIFVGFYDHNRKQLGRMYFSSFQKAGDAYYPGKITEIMYLEKKDSMVTTKRYSNARINGSADSRYINYRIPTNARIIEQ